MKKLFLSLFTILAFFSININVEAKSSFYQFDDNLDIENKFDGSVFFAGETVFTKSEVDGIAFIGGNNVEVNGQVDYGFFAGNSIKITGKVDNDLFAAGSNISINDNASVERDSYLAASTINIKDAKFGRDVKMAAATITLRDVTINGDVYISATNIKLDNNVVINGKLSYNEDAVISGIDDNNIGEVDTYKTNIDESTTLLSNVKSKLFSIISGFIILVIMFLAFPNLFKKIDTKINDNKIGNYFTKAGIGFIGLIIIPIISIISICTIIGMPIGLILIAAYIVSLYFAILLSAYVLGNKIYTTMFKKEYNFYTVSFIGLIVIKALDLIPVVSGIVGLFSLLFGLGMIISLFIKDKK